MFTELEEIRVRKETEVARRIKGRIKRSEIQPVISSLSVLHCPEHTKRFTEFGRKERGWGGGNRGDLVEKKESPKGERAVKLVLQLPSKMGTEDCVLKGTKLITNTKKHKLKI